MSDKTRAPRPSRGGSGVIICGLAVGAVLGAPVAAAASSCVADLSAATVTTAASISQQFEESFTAGAVIETVTDSPWIICVED